MSHKLASKPTWVNRWEVESRTEPGKTYVVGQKSDGSFGCACPRWIFSKERPRPDCHHIKAIKNNEPIDFSKTSQTAAAEYKHFEGAMDTSQPVFLLQTRRCIIVE